MVIPAIVKDSEFRSEANSTVLKRNHSVVGIFNVISLISCSPVNVPTLLKCTANIFFFLNRLFSAILGLRRRRVCHLDGLHELESRAPTIFDETSGHAN